MEKSGIYQIINLQTRKSYIGSSKNLQTRKYQHWYRLKANIHPNQHLQNAWNKYTKNSFIFIILEQCDINSLLNKEQYYIDILKPEFNIRKECINNKGFKHSEITKIEISNTSKKRWNENREKMTECLYKPILCYNKKGEFIKEYKSVKEASLDIKTFSTNISQVLKDKNIFVKGFHFKYKINNEIIKQIVIRRKRKRN